MLVTIRKTKNHTLIERLDETIFGKAETSDADPADVTWFLLVVDGKIAGFAGLEVFPCGTERWGFLERAGILKPFRGRGLQKALIAARDKEAARLKLVNVCTYTAFGNNASANSLIKSGYKIYTPQTQFGLKGALYWIKHLGGTK